jgi:hypothetical protein
MLLFISCSMVALLLYILHVHICFKCFSFGENHAVMFHIL